MTDRKVLDRIAQSAGAKQTGFRFQYSRFEVWKSLGSAANE